MHIANGFNASSKKKDSKLPSSMKLISHFDGLPIPEIPPSKKNKDLLPSSYKKLPFRGNSAKSVSSENNVSVYSEASDIPV